MSVEEDIEKINISTEVREILDELRTDDGGRKSYNGKIKEILEAYDNLFIPCLITIERDPSVYGKPRFDYVVHRWNKGDNHIYEEVIEDVKPVPVPLGTVMMMNSPEDDFYKPSQMLFCSCCFPEKEPFVDHHNP